MRHWWIVLLISLCSVATAKTALETQLDKLPVSLGENEIIDVKSDQSWVDVGIDKHVGFNQLSRANHGNIDQARKLFIAGRHQVPALTKDGLVINLPELMEYRIKKGKVVAWYPVSIGRITSRWHTPVGNLKVTSREINPTWDKPKWAGGGKVKPGPKNPLGDRWIGLNRPGYGLHGTNDPSSIGRLVSHGCIRHFPQHIRELFEMTHVGMPVIITYQTVTVGEDNGIVYLAVMPDIYGWGTNAPASVHKRLASMDLDGVLSGSELEQRLARADGIARPLLGSKTKVIVNLLPSGSPIGPTFKQGTNYLPLRPLAKAIGAKVEWDAKTKTTMLTRRNKQVSIPPDSGFTALGSRFIPIRSTVEALGGKVSTTKGWVKIWIL